MVDRWTFALTATGMSTGREWAGVLQSPTQLNGGPGEVLQDAIRGVIRGITKGAPNFAWTGSFKSTVNANGELVVLRDTEGFAARCLGKKNEHRANAPEREGLALREAFSRASPLLAGESIGRRVVSRHASA